MSPNSFSGYKLEEVTKEFGIKVSFKKGLFKDVKQATVSQKLIDDLDRNTPLALAMSSEKAKSELIVMPVLLELWDQVEPKFSFFSGIEFRVEPKRGLKGVCDFIISRSENQAVLTAPVVTLVEAKRDDFEKGLAQCLAEMVAAQIFNERNQTNIETIYGVITNGTTWRFLRLKEKNAEVNVEDYPIQNVEMIIGILKYMQAN